MARQQVRRAYPVVERQIPLTVTSKTDPNGKPDGLAGRGKGPVMGCTGCFTRQVRLSLFLQRGEVAWRRLNLMI